MNKYDLADALRSKLYGEHVCIGDAYVSLLEQCRGTGLLVEVHKLLNTLAKEIEKLDDVGGEVQKYTEDRDKWYELELAVVSAMAGGIFKSLSEATPFIDDLYDHHIEYVRGLEQDRLVEFVKQVDPELLKIVEV